MRIASPFLYDTLLLPFELMAIRKWRRCLWSQVRGTRILDAGGGTGLNIPFYNPGQDVTLLERERACLQRARRRARVHAVQVDMIQGDVKALEFPEESFDTTVASFLFCSLDNPEKGLSELYRVLKPGGALLLLEHVRSSSGLGRVMDALSRPLYRLFNEHIARETDKEVLRTGFVNVVTQPLFLDVVKLIRAEKPPV